MVYLQNVPARTVFWPDDPVQARQSGIGPSDYGGDAIYDDGDSADDIGHKDQDQQFYNDLKLQIAWEDVGTFHYRELLESIAVSKEHLMFIISFQDRMIILPGNGL